MVHAARNGASGGRALDLGCAVVIALTLLGVYLASSFKTLLRLVTLPFNAILAL
jgi:hypothetical protein